MGLGLAAWVGNALYALGDPGSLLKEWSPALVAGAMIAFLVVHGRRLHSGRQLFLFVLTVFLVGWFFETVSVMTGFPFGDYHYTGIMAPFIGHVPVFVMPAYCVMGYASWSFARLLLARTDAADDAVFRFGVPVIAAMLMVVWDLSMDPLRATVEGRWVWLDGGPHFGVPLANFFGWALVTWIMFQLFALVVSSSPEQPARLVEPGGRRLYWLSVPLVWTAFAGEYLLNPVLSGRVDAVVIDGAGVPVAEIFASVALLTATTMLPLAALGVLAAIRLGVPASDDDEAGALVPDRAGGDRR
ncbi:MAG: carotenoid biosynthesis protein [Rhizobiaceae bacterium]|nr:carotenoid biosynthesis protein [Rhizobiaceae bacterium]